MGRRKIKNESAGDTNGSKPVYTLRKWAKPQPGPVQGELFGQVATTTKGDEKRPIEAAAGAARSAAFSEHRTAAAGGVGPLFQSYGHCCDKNEPRDEPVRDRPIRRPEDLGEVVGHEYRIRPCRCRRWFCPYCGPRQGWNLRQKLILRLMTFTRVFGVTLTVDGSLFNSPLAAWLYVMGERLLSRFIRELDRRGLLHSSAYFWVVEFQKKTEQPHWHLLLDAGAIDYGEIVEIWSRFRPPHAAPLAEPVTKENYKGQAPAFGSVRFSPPTHPLRAGYYATKYLTKYPDDGYPAWVLDRVGRMPRYGHSRRFFPRPTGHDSMCFCDECRGEAEIISQKNSEKKSKEENPLSRPRSTTTIRQRLEQCGNCCTIVQVRLVELPDGTITEGQAKYDGILKLSFPEACESLGVSPDGIWQLEVSGPEATALQEYAEKRRASGEAA